MSPIDILFAIKIALSQIIISDSWIYINDQRLVLKKSKVLQNFRKDLHHSQVLKNDRSFVKIDFWNWGIVEGNMGNDSIGSLLSFSKLKTPFDLQIWRRKGADKKGVCPMNFNLVFFEKHTF